MDQYDIIGEICAEALLSRRDANYLMNIVQKHFIYLANGYLGPYATKSRLMLKNFGSFDLRYHQPRVIKDPETGIPAAAPAHYVLRFTPSLLMRAIANSELPVP